MGSKSPTCWIGRAVKTWAPGLHAAVSSGALGKKNLQLLIRVPFAPTTSTKPTSCNEPSWTGTAVVLGSWTYLTTVWLKHQNAMTCDGETHRTNRYILCYVISCSKKKLIAPEKIEIANRKGRGPPTICMVCKKLLVYVTKRTIKYWLNDLSSAKFGMDKIMSHVVLCAA
jgi:hypothetical protein